MGIRRISVVLNGKAGALLDQADAHEKLEAALKQAGLEAEFVPVDAGSLPERVAIAARSGADAVVVAGGDGTVACAGHALAGQDVPLGILPFGTMNLLAKDLALPIGDVESALQVIAAGQIRSIDAAEVNGHTFLCASMMGMPTQLGRTREETRGSALRLWSRMAAAAARLLRRAKRLAVRMQVDGEASTVRASSLTVTVNLLNEGSGRSFGRLRLDGGRLGLYVIPRLGPWRAVRLVLSVALGRWRTNAAVVEREAGEVVIASRTALHVMNDGEMLLLDPPLTYRIRPGALRVLAP